MRVRDVFNFSENTIIMNELNKLTLSRKSSRIVTAKDVEDSGDLFPYQINFHSIKQ